MRYNRRFLPLGSQESNGKRNFRYDAVESRDAAINASPLVAAFVCISCAAACCIPSEIGVAGAVSKRRGREAVVVAGDGKN